MLHVVAFYDGDFEPAHSVGMLISNAHMHEQTSRKTNFFVFIGSALLVFDLVNLITFPAIPLPAAHWCGNFVVFFLVLGFTTVMDTSHNLDLGL